MKNIEKRIEAGKNIAKSARRDLSIPEAVAIDELSTIDKKWINMINGYYYGFEAGIRYEKAKRKAHAAT